MQNRSLGLDVGGSHVTASVIDPTGPGQQVLRLVRKPINSFDTASGIIQTISDCIREAVPEGVAEVGIAFPGPFDYDKGVSVIRNVGGKFERTFGLHLKQALADATGLGEALFRFSNDAHCFAVGAYSRHRLSGRRGVFLTLGTGFGSAFMADGRLAAHHPALPAGGAFYAEPFGESIADDYFSTRWFYNQYKKATGGEIGGVRELAEMDSEVARDIFCEFGKNLSLFLAPWLEQFECDELVIGGNISRANALFAPTLKRGLEVLDHDVRVTFCSDTEECVLTGAAGIAQLEKANATGPNAELLYASGFDVNALADKMCREKTATVDSSERLPWETIRQELHTALTKRGKQVLWYDIDSCLKAGVKASEMQAGEQDLLSVFFDIQKIEMLRPDHAADLCIVYGTGASLSNWGGETVRLDLVHNAG